jgi:hypothetical protein
MAGGQYQYNADQKDPNGPQVQNGPGPNAPQYYGNAQYGNAPQAPQYTQAPAPVQPPAQAQYGQGPTINVVSPAGGPIVDPNQQQYCKSLLSIESNFVF